MFAQNIYSDYVGHILLYFLYVFTLLFQKKAGQIYKHYHCYL